MRLSFFRERLAGAPGEDQEFPDLMNIHSVSVEAALSKP
jgi:hypothetical protein